MASSFSCNQYDHSFRGNQLGNWERPKWYKRSPLPHEGFTQFMSNNRGHLLPEITRSAKSPWGTYMGTWDLPKNIPGNKMMDPMSRTERAYCRNMEEKCSADTVIRGRLKVRRPRAGPGIFAQVSEGKADMPMVAYGAAQPQDQPPAERMASPAVPIGLLGGSPKRFSANVMSPRHVSAAAIDPPYQARPLSQQRPASHKPTTPKPATPAPAFRVATPLMRPSSRPMSGAIGVGAPHDERVTSALLRAGAAVLTSELPSHTPVAGPAPPKSPAVMGRTSGVMN